MSPQKEKMVAPSPSGYEFTTPPSPRGGESGWAASAVNALCVQFLGPEKRGFGPDLSGPGNSRLPRWGPPAPPINIPYLRSRLRAHDHHSPFQAGYLITWIDWEKSRDEALADAVDITNTALSQRETTNPVIKRVHSMRDLVLEATKLKDIVSFTYLHNMLKCSERGNVLLKTVGVKRPNFIAIETLPEILLERAYEFMEVRKMACPW